MNESAASVIHHPAEAELFDDTLSCELSLPAEFVPGTAVVRPGVTESLLRSVALVEDSRGAEENEERNETTLQIQRLEARLDLALLMLGRLVRENMDVPPLRPLRWSKRGLRLELGQRSGVPAGTQGLVRLQPSDWLPDLVELPVSLLAEGASPTGGWFLWLRLEQPGDALEMALERHLFRVHRRQIAAARRQR